ncbi:hypothetical protein C1H46_016151 [Malus baccata]|uniref:Uncharacterized protein n=1 Tax=Malus baccata TaxID=106549 RepID=A0A540MHG3_MALBA|nr:hypothetical protein C1H46_016151 [Malus baccata]
MYRLNNSTNNRIDPERVGKLPLPSDHPATPDSWRMRDRLFRSHSNHSASAAFFFNSGSARESAGNNRKEGVHVAAAPAPFWAAGSASTRKDIDQHWR